MRREKQLANLVVIGTGLVVLPAGLFLLVTGRASPTDIALILAFYLPISLGITAGYHRLLAHESFQTRPTIRYGLVVLGAAAIQGPVIEWVSDHRKHHAYADREDDPHSPYWQRAGGLAGFWHAHVGWLFCNQGSADPRRYAPDLLADHGIRLIDRLNPAIALLGLAVPAVIGLILGGPYGALRGLFWGGLFRAAMTHHVTFAVNSVCHIVGARPYATRDKSRNLAILALPTLGDAWHHNHHRFPRSACHGLFWWQLDPTAWFILIGGRLGLAWQINRPAAALLHKASSSRQV
jgi:stearoyl-CoA desaturase (delta-9 desaturase)